MTDEITQKYEALGEFPLIGRRRLELGDNYRSLPIGNYVIYYRASETKLEISRILHGARDLTGIFSPESEED